MTSFLIGEMTSENLSRALYLLGGLPSLWLAAIIIYRLLLHPYGRYPGPFLAKITNLYAAYHAWKGDLHVDMWRCHQKYGHHVRYAPNRLLFDTEGALHAIYNHRSNVTKSTTYNTLVHMTPNTLTLRDKKQHGQKRRVMSQGFSDSALRSFEPTILEQISKFCSKIGEPGIDSAWSAPQDMAEWCDWLAFDIMSAVIFSSSYDLLGSNTYRSIPKDIEKSNVRMSVLFQAPEISGWRFHRRFFPEAMEGRKSFLNFLNSLIQQRVPRGKGEPDIFSFIAKAVDPATGNGFSEGELRGETATLIVAGADTSSAALAGVFFYLSRNVQARMLAAAEVRGAFASSADITAGAALNSCAFLRACIDETLRISPPAGSALWRTVQEAGMTVDGQFIPEGCDVGVSAYALHHNPASFAKPTQWRPERWLSATSIEDVDDGSAQRPDRLLHQAFAPFSVGPRGCIGKSLAMMELMLTVAHVLWRYDFESAEQDGKVADENDRGDDLQDEYYLRDHITGAKHGPMLKFRERA